jgi:hypothetical protein
MKTIHKRILVDTGRLLGMCVISKGFINHYFEKPEIYLNYTDILNGKCKCPLNPYTKAAKWGL